MKNTAGQPVPIPIRNPALTFDDSIKRYWFNDNPVVTHGFNGFNLAIPEIERYFVRSVNNVRQHITDPALLDQIHGFCGQEAMHAKVHEDYFQWLRAKGYRLNRYLAWLKKYILYSEKMNTPNYNLAATAAAEHLTATIGILFLTQPNLMHNLHPVMARFLTWHSAEELEHKAVTFDVMRAVNIGYLLRIFAYSVTLLEIFIWTTLAIYMLARQDNLSLWAMYKYKRQFRKEVNWGSWRFIKFILAYYRPGFHPNNTAEIHVAQAYLQKLGVQPP